MSPSLTVSIVSFNTRRLLKNCLEDVLNQTNLGNVKIYVVDNASWDGSADLIEKEFKGKLDLIRNNTNRGFSKAHNQIFKLLKSDYCMVLNPDTKIPPDAFSKMIKFMEENKKCGIASCKIVGFNEGLHSNGGDFPIGLAFLSWIFNLEIVRGLPNFHREEKKYFIRPHQVDWVGGTLMIIRKKVIQEVGLFNEDYFMYFEDVEYCYRAKKGGFEVWINPYVEIKHLGGASSTDPKFNQWCGEFRGVIDFYRAKLFKGIKGGISSLLVKLLIYLGIIFRIIFYSFLGKFNFSLTYAKVFFNI